VSKIINVGGLLEAGRITFKGSKEHNKILKQTFDCYINIVFYIARTRKDTTIYLEL
jgi:hypothetical protein